jgi:hypothetical protein
MKPISVWYDYDKDQHVAWSPDNFPEITPGRGETATLAVSDFTVNLCNKASLLLQLANERTYIMADSEGTPL